MKKISLMAMMFAVSIVTASALEIDISKYSISELKYLVSQMNSRINELETTNSKKCFVTDNALSLGDGEGALMQDVKKLQDFLREKGHFKTKSTGYFGKVTRAALISYQASTGVAQTGEFDQATQQMAHAGTCGLIKTEDKTIKKEEMKKDLGKKEEIKKEEMKKEQYKDTNEKKKDNLYYQSNISSITLSQSSLNGVMWSPVGSSPNGYKVISSKSPNPIYPPKDGDTADFYDANTIKASIKAHSGSGVYYVRVCEYLNGKCGIYSNEIKLELN